MFKHRKFRLLSISFVGLSGLALVLSELRTQAQPTSDPGASDDAARVDFSREIRPILAENCFACHGPDAGARKARLRLDLREDAIKVRRSGSAAIVPGESAGSLLIEMITEPDAEFRMPPPESKKQLTPEEIERLRQWIDQGAEYERHWAFVAPKLPALPEVRWPERVRNPIDSFILARLDDENFKPSPEASRETLLRRVSFDLTGLPPSIEELDAFLEDDSPDAYEKNVDRLLASPRFGERMAQDWLDAARYADTHGYHYDNERSMWRWREWVIKAFNRNLPYDRFTVEQLAGDLLPEPTIEQRIATGFNRNHGISWEGGIIPEEYRIEYVVDRVNTTATVWMGLTMACARCHDHKYDPITQREFYQFSAFFNSIAEKGSDGLEGNASPMIPTPTEAQARELEQLEKDFEALAATYDAPHEELDRAQARWEREIRERLDRQWSIVDPIEYSTSGKAVLVEQDDHSLFAEGPHPINDVYEVMARVDQTRIGVVRFEAMADARLPGGGPGRAEHSNFVLSEFELEVAPASDPDRFTQVKFISAQADYSQKGFFIRKAIDGQQDTGWAVEGQPYGEDRTAVFVPEKPFGFEGGTILRFRIHHESDYLNHSIGRVRWAVSSDEGLRESLLPSRLSDWQVSEPYSAETGALAFETAFDPESGVHFAAKDEAGNPKWHLKPEFTDASIHSLAGESTATYLARTIESAGPRLMQISIGSDDGIKIWLNAELVFSTEAPRGAAPDQDFIQLDLKKGVNVLLLKVVNYSGEYAFYFDVREDNSLETPMDIITKIDRPPERSGERQRKAIRDHFRAHDSEDMRSLIAELRTLEESRDTARANIPTTMVMEELQTPRDTFRLSRGMYDQPMEKVSAGIPAFLPALGDGEHPNRLSLARWLVDPGHPLTARVAVNRLWQLLFGAGLVRTPEDFGTRGEAPSHPKLLDWLALEFVRLEWDVKAMLKLMVMSSTYRQDSAASGEVWLRDPENRLLSRGPRYRLSAEMIRDSALAVSGLLEERRGGPSVKPYQPPGLWKEIGSDFEAFSANLYKQDHGEALYRRSLYTFWKRTLPPPALQMFDAPLREYCVVRRARTNTPQQALVLMNDPTFVEAARVLAQRILLEGEEDPSARLNHAFRLVIARHPTSNETRVLLSLYREQCAKFREDPEAARRLLNIGESPRDPSLEATEHAAWTIVTSTILNLDEAITKG